MTCFLYISENWGDFVMKKDRIISMILAFILILTGTLFFKQQNQLKKAENALFDVAISNTVIQYDTHSLSASLNEVTQKKVLHVHQDGSSNIESDVQNISSAYRELYQYYIAYGGNQPVGNQLQEILQNFQTFFHYLASFYKQDISSSNKDEYLYFLPLKDEAEIGLDIIATVMKDLENIRSEVYKDQATEDKESWKTLITKNEHYAQTAEVQQYKEKIQQLIHMWSE